MKLGLNLVLKMDGIHDGLKTVEADKMSLLERKLFSMYSNHLILFRGVVLERTLNAAFLLSSV